MNKGKNMGKNPAPEETPLHHLYDMEGPGNIRDNITEMHKNGAKRPTPFISRERSKGTWEDDTNIRNLLHYVELRTQPTAMSFSEEILRKEKEP